MAERRIKMAYRVVGPKKVTQTYTHASMDEETKSLQQELRTREVDMYMVYLPAGHSIRIDRKELERLGYHKKPRMVDMDTGDVVDLGGDDWDIPVPADEVVVEADDDEEDEEAVTSSRNRRKAS